MKNQIIFKKFSWLLVIAFVAGLALSACKRSEEHPAGKEHPATNPPAKTP